MLILHARVIQCLQRELVRQSLSITTNVCTSIKLVNRKLMPNKYGIPLINSQLANKSSLITCYLNGVPIFHLVTPQLNDYSLRHEPVTPRKHESVSMAEVVLRLLRNESEQSESCSNRSNHGKKRYREILFSISTTMVNGIGLMWLRPQHRNCRLFEYISRGVPVTRT